MKIECPHCDQRIALDPDGKESEGLCPTCGGHMIILDEILRYAIKHPANLPAPVEVIPPPKPFPKVLLWALWATSHLMHILWLTGFLCVILVFILGVEGVAVVYRFMEVGIIIFTVVVFPVSLLLCIFRRSRMWGAVGVLLVSFLFGFAQWFYCMLYCAWTSKAALIIGILMGGVGVVPMGLIIMIAHGDFAGFFATLFSFAACGFFFSMALKSIEKRIQDYDESVR